MFDFMTLQRLQKYIPQLEAEVPKILEEVRAFRAEIAEARREFSEGMRMMKAIATASNAILDRVVLLENDVNGLKVQE